MCSILGLVNFRDGTNGIGQEVLEAMRMTTFHRGPDQHGFFRSSHVCFAHNRLAVIDVENGLQPMSAVFEGNTYTIVYNGELYNADELRSELIDLGVNFKTHCDTEVLLYAYILWGVNCSEKLNGIFAFAVHDEARHHVYISRDRVGVKPFFYTFLGDTLIFSSEVKAILMHPKVRAELDNEGIWKLLYLSPMRPSNNGIFKNIYEVSPGFHGIFNENGLQFNSYWNLQAYDVEDNENTIVEKTRFYLTDAIQRQLVSDVPLCTLLSGGLDSSVVTAVARADKKNGEMLSTYSFEYEGNKKHFSSTNFQPESDDSYAVWLSEYLGTNHTVLNVSQKAIADLLFDAVKFRDYPGMADIDSSLLYYCKEIKKRHTVALSGECADEIFGGYPWFYRPEMLHRDFFPWIHDPESRIFLFDSDFAKPKPGMDFVNQLYSDSVDSCPLTGSETEEMKTARIANWLSINWFMVSLLERRVIKVKQSFFIISPIHL
jgi:asparagine synthase (glutamine-hydrolysing)